MTDIRVTTVFALEASNTRMSKVPDNRDRCFTRLFSTFTYRPVSISPKDHSSGSEVGQLGYFVQYCIVMIGNETS